MKSTHKHKEHSDNNGLLYLFVTPFSYFFVWLKYLIEFLLQFLLIFASQIFKSINNKTHASFTESDSSDPNESIASFHRNPDDVVYILPWSNF